MNPNAKPHRVFVQLSNPIAKQGAAPDPIENTFKTIFPLFKPYANPTARRGLHTSRLQCLFQNVLCTSVASLGACHKQSHKVSWISGKRVAPLGCSCNLSKSEDYPRFFGLANTCWGLDRSSANPRQMLLIMESIMPRSWHALGLLVSFCATLIALPREKLSRCWVRCKLLSQAQPPVMVVSPAQNGNMPAILVRILVVRKGTSGEPCQQQAQRSSR